MERLTVIDDDGNVCRANSAISDRDAWHRLAAYEDTGLTPEEITNLITRMDAGLREYEKLTDAVNDIGGWSEVGRLVRAQQDGMLVELPCKVGDTVYVVQQVGSGHWEQDKYILDDEGTPKVYEKKFNLMFLDYIGKTVFLTRAEAESAIKSANTTQII